METVQPTTPALPASQAGGLARGFALLGALIVLVVGSVFSLGAVLLAPAGMAIGAYIWRRRGRILSAIGHWVAAACASALVALAFAGAIRSFIPSDLWTKARQAADSTQKAQAKEPLPPWLQRVAPAAGRVPPTPPSERAQTVTLAFGAAIMLMIFVGFFGTVGWLAGMLLGLAIFGRWPGLTGRLAPE
jgi:hypothetical protein